MSRVRVVHGGDPLSEGGGGRRGKNSRARRVGKRESSAQCSAGLDALRALVFRVIVFNCFFDPIPAAPSTFIL